VSLAFEISSLTPCKRKIAANAPVDTHAAHAIHLDVLNSKTANAIVEGNRLGRLASGIWFNPLTQATGKYRDNITTNVTIPYTGGTDAGNND